MLKTLSSLSLLALLAGCASARPAFTVEMNGRRVEFESFQAGKIPRGNEVSYFDRQSLHVAGDVPVELNGVSVLASDEGFTLGGRRFVVDGDARVVVRKDGEIHVSMKAQPGATAAPPVAPAASADPKTSR